MPPYSNGNHQQQHQQEKPPPLGLSGAKISTDTTSMGKGSSVSGLNGPGGGGPGSLNGQTANQYGANPKPGWSMHVGPSHKAPPPVATQLVVPSELSDHPVTLTCFHCQQHVTTKTKTGPSFLTWSLCACMCIFVCWPFCLVPFCCNPLNVTEHYCPNCNTLLGKYKAWKKSSK